MALEFADGFDFYASAADITVGAGPSTSVWNSTLGLIETGPSFPGRFSGSNAVGIVINSVLLSSSYLQRTLSSNFQTLFGVAALQQIVNSPGSTSPTGFMKFLDGTTVQLSIFWTQGGSIQVYRGDRSVLLQTWTGVFNSQIWNHYQVYVKIDPSAGFVRIRQNGQTSDTFSLTGVNTRVSANSYCNSFRLGCDALSLTAFWDDFITFTDTGATPNTWVGDIRAIQLMPTADTAQKQFTPKTGVTNYNQVNEPQENGDTTYVQDSTVGDFDLYDCADLPYIPTSIVGIQTKGYIKKADTDPISGAVRIKSGATSVDSATMALSSNYQWLVTPYMADPNTSANWTYAGVNAVQIGPKVVA